jgi:hypothetical protein
MNPLACEDIKNKIVEFDRFLQKVGLESPCDSSRG